MEGRRILTTVQWIATECGGRQHPAFVGYRPTIRWQRYVKAFLVGAWDTQLARIEPAPERDCSIVELDFSPRAVLHDAWLADGELFDLLEGARVVGVGRICAPTIERSSPLAEHIPSAPVAVMLGQADALAKPFVERGRILANVQWISVVCGGHTRPPKIGYRTNIRWQHHVETWLARDWGVEILNTSPSPDGRYAVVEMLLSSRLAVRDAWLAAGLRIELLKGDVIVGVGTICTSPSE